MVLTLRLSKKGSERLKNLQKIADTNALVRGLLEFFDKQGNRIAGRIVREFLSGQLLGRRTGNLARSIVGVGEEQDTGLPGMRVGVLSGPAQAYAGVHEFGTRGKNPNSPFPTIKPKRAKALAFPVPDGPATTRAGVHRYDSPRQFPGELRFIPFRDSGIAVGGLYTETSVLAAREAAKASGLPVSLRDMQLVYVLLRKLDIEPKFYLRDGLQAALPGLASLLGKFLKQFLEAQIEGKKPK